jgi:hypothetical protein
MYRALRRRIGCHQPRHRSRQAYIMTQHQPHHRRSVRIHGAEYTTAGGYVITICAADRRNIFERIENGSAKLSALGQIVAECCSQFPKHFVQAELRDFVVMPNHLHDIIVLRPKLVGARYIVPCGGASPNAGRVSEARTRLDSHDCANVQSGGSPTSEKRTGLRDYLATKLL